MISKKIIIGILSFIFIFSLVFFNNINGIKADGEEGSGSGGSSFDEMGAQADAFKGTSGLPSTSAPEMIRSIITMVLSLLAIVFIILMIYSGFQWMTAGGNEDQIKKAQARIKNAIIGLAIIVLAYGITALVFRSLPSVEDGTTQGTVGGETQ